MAEKEYTEREKVNTLIKNYGIGAIEDGRKTLDPVDDIVMLAKGLDFIPAADVVEVVRCKDCVNSTRHDGYSCYCNYFLDYVSLNGFCSYGEKMDGKEQKK
jgi:hypothetical protein